MLLRRGERQATCQACARASRSGQFARMFFRQRGLTLDHFDLVELITSRSPLLELLDGRTPSRRLLDSSSSSLGGDPSHHRGLPAVDGVLDETVEGLWREAGRAVDERRARRRGRCAHSRWAARCSTCFTSARRSTRVLKFSHMCFLPPVADLDDSFGNREVTASSSFEHVLQYKNCRTLHRTRNAILILYFLLSAHYCSPVRLSKEYFSGSS